MPNSNPIVLEFTYNAGINDVWNAITERDKMIQWFFDNIESFKAEVGFETQFNIHNEGVDYLHMWKVTEVVPGKKIVCNWKFKGYTGNSFVTFELSPAAGGTNFKLINEGQESFPSDNPVFSRESCTEGWNFLLGKRLKEFLEK